MHEHEKEYEKHGKTIIIVGSAMIPILLIFSSGYNPNGGLLVNLYYTLTIYSGEWFCHQVPAGGFSIGKVKECTDVVLWTKHLIAICVLAITYGVLVLKKLAPDPVAFLKRKVQSIDRSHEIGARSNPDDGSK